MKKHCEVVVKSPGEMSSQSTIVRLLLGLLLPVFFSCSEKQEASTPKAVPAAAPDASSVQKAPLGKQQTDAEFRLTFRSAFIKSCVEKAPGKQDVCECGVTRLLDEFPRAELEKISPAAMEKLEDSIMPDCLKASLSQ